MAPFARGCGYRKVGGVYVVTGTSPYGKPVENFIVEPSGPSDPEQMGLAAIGVMPIRIAPQDEQVHLLNWVGEEHYPNVTDFIEEVRRRGGSSRIPKNFDFESIKGKPYIYHMHAHAWIENALEYQLDPPAELRQEIGHGTWLENIAASIAGEISVGRRPCPTKRHSDTSETEMCGRLWWEDVHGGEYVVADKDDREVSRQIGDVTYRAYTPPKGVTPRYLPAVFFRLPIHRLEVIRDPAGNEHDEALEKALYADMEVKLVDF